MAQFRARCRAPVSNTGVVTLSISRRDAKPPAAFAAAGMRAREPVGRPAYAFAAAGPAAIKPFTFSTTEPTVLKSPTSSLAL